MSRHRLLHLRLYREWLAEQRANVEPMGFLPGVWTCGLPRQMTAPRPEPNSESKAAAPELAREPFEEAA